MIQEEDVLIGTNEKQLAKLKHVNACLLSESQYQKSAGFEAIHFIHESAAEMSVNDISLETTFLGHVLMAPLMIAPMTGGTELSSTLNRRFARAAQHFGIPFGVGSQRLALEDESARQSFMVREHAPSAMIFANLGAAQLRGSDKVTRALKAVEMISADALFIHINPLQEACKAGGDVDFENILRAIAEIAREFVRHKIPVLVREVGFGLSESSAKALLNTGISGLDCAGAGGTSWTKVEGLCATDARNKRLGQIFGEWGIPTVQSIRNVRRMDKKIPLIATGGIRSGLDVAKVIALGGNLASMAQPMLIAAVKSEAELFSFIEQVLVELRIAMFAAGAKEIVALNSSRIDFASR